MKNSLSSYDFQELSGYLDRQLSPENSASMEARLRDDPVLQAAYRDLAQVRAVLKTAPRLRAQRNFMLSPEQAGIRKNKLSFPILRFAATLASILFVVVLLGDLISQPGPKGQEIQVEMAVESKKMLPSEAPLAMGGGSENLPPGGVNTPTPLPRIPQVAVEAPPVAQEKLAQPTNTPETLQQALLEDQQLQIAPYPSPTTLPEEEFQVDAGETAYSIDQILSGLRIFVQSNQILWRGIEVLLGLLVIMSVLMLLFLRRS